MEMLHKYLQYCIHLVLTFIDIGSDDYDEDNDDEAIDQSDLLEAVVGVGDARHLGPLPGHQPQGSDTAGSGRGGNTRVCKSILLEFYSIYLFNE